MVAGWEIAIGKELFNKLYPIVEGCVTSAVGDRIAPKTLERQVRRISKTLAASMSEYASNLPQKHRASASAAANDFLYLAKKFQLSFATILDADMDSKRLATNMLATAPDNFASGSRRAILSDMCEAFCEQLILSLLTMPEFNLQFMARCLRTLSDISKGTVAAMKLLRDLNLTQTTGDS
jgi:hypothetical protein